jgi:hypothetical protein
LTSFRLLIVTAIAMLPAAVAVPAAGGERVNSDGSPATFNYAFATQLGSGIYRVNDRTVQVYRLSGPIGLRDPGIGRWGIVLRLPVTFGFYDFKIEDVVDTGLPDKLGTLALVPTVEFEYRAKETWWLGPFVGLGAGKDYSGGAFNWIYALGFRSLALFPLEHVDIRLGNRLVYTGYTNEDMDFVDDFAFLETGGDFRRPLGFALGAWDIDGSVFGANYIYFISPHIVRLIPEPVEMKTEWEIGFTLGTVEPLKVLGVRMPRLGLSYRFGTGMDAIRFIIGNPFPIDTPADRGPAVN